MASKKWLTFGMAGFLCSCSSPPPPPPPPPAAVIERQVSQIETAGIQIIQHGDRVTLIIPTDRFFEPMETKVRREQKTNLELMGRFVKRFSDQYPKSIIRVTGYSDRVFNQRTQLQLSQGYADAIASYIFDAGVSRNRLAVQGRGSNEPIANEYQATSMALNRRVVVQIN